MTQFFRFLLITYLIGSGTLVLLLLGSQQYQAEQRWHSQLQQYAELLNVSLRAFLTHNSAEQISSQLLELQYNALLPVAALGVYYPDGEPLAMSGFSNMLPTHLSVTPGQRYQLMLLGSKKAAILPLDGQVAAIEQVLSYQAPEGYLVIVPEGGADKRQGVMLTSLVWSIYTLIFLVLAWYFRSWLQQRTALLLTLPDGVATTVHSHSPQPNPPALPAELRPLQSYLMQTATDLGAAQQLQQEQGAELQRLTQALAEMTAQQQQTEQQWLGLQKEICQWISHTQLLWQRQEQLSPPVFFALTHLQLLYGHYQFNSAKLEPSRIQLSDWLANNIPNLNQLLPETVGIDWLEGQDNTSAAVSLAEPVLAAILQALLLLALRSDNLTRLLLRIQLERLAQPQLVIQINCDGQGLAPDLHKQLKSSQATQWQWRDIDLVLLQRLAQMLNAKLKVQSLEGLGLSVALHLPVSLAELPFVAKMGHILLLDEDAERLAERATALKALAVQVTGCRVRTDLPKLLDKKPPDMMILMLPAEAPSQEWLTLIRQTALQLSLQVFAPASHLVQWQAVVPCHSAAEFSLKLVAQQPRTAAAVVRSKNLLVVDDNETNQAFIRILLQQKAVNFQAAFTGSEVLQLCQQQQFDLILLDISLPDISGVEVARQLRRLPAYEKTPILAFTAHALPAEIAEFKLAGMDDILLKPLDPAKFETLLARYQLY